MLLSACHSGMFVISVTVFSLSQCELVYNFKQMIPSVSLYKCT